MIFLFQLDITYKIYFNKLKSEKFPWVHSVWSQSTAQNKISWSPLSTALSVSSKKTELGSPLSERALSSKLTALTARLS